VSAAVTTLDVARLSASGRSVTSCVHCGAALPGDAAGAFCCRGCASAYAFVQELGLQRYYDTRSLDRRERLPRPPDECPDDATAYAVSGTDGTTSLSLMIDGLHCAACVWLIEQVLARDPAVISARVNLTGRRLTLRWTGGAEIAQRLVQTVQCVGYRAVPFDGERPGFSDDERALLRAVAVAGFATANVMLLSVSVWAGFPGEMGPATRDLMHWISALIALPAIAYAGQPFFRSAIVALRAWRSNMDVPISAGVTLAAAMSLWETARSGGHAYFESVVMLLFFLLLGRYLDRRARGRARSAAEHLVRFARVPATLVAADGSTRRISSASLRPGDTVLIATGERVPADGRVTLGASSLDRSLVDGETIAAVVGPGSGVLAGMLNLSAPLRVLVTAVGEQTYLAEVVRLMEAAERGRAHLVALSDRVARRYAPAVHLLALATFLGWALAGPWQAALLNAVAVLIITCPCALGLAVPVVQVVASNRLFRCGILLKSATALERLAEVDTVVFDKTGTLTLGRPELITGCALNEKDLELASGLAARSRHPLSRALRRAAPNAPVLEGVEEHPGQGLSCAVTGSEARLGNRRWCGIPDPGTEDGIDAELWLVAPGRAPARFRFHDALRPDAGDVVARLQARGKRVMVLSGDRPAAVSAVAEALGISDWQADVTPAQKFRTLESLAAGGVKVLMVGDGLNDGPALAAARVSISPSTAADVCQTAADVVFQGASLRAVLDVLDVARQSGWLIRENIGLAILYNFAAVPLAMAGFITPLLAAAAMSCSSILVVANSLRLGRER
jgi:Cu2+-exporting ATPase